MSAIAGQTLPSLLRSLPVTRVTSDSREVTAGTIFVAVRGEKQDGHGFIDSAIRLGAVAVVGEEEREDLNVPYLKVPSARTALAELASLFYREPSREMMVVGVTGTSGKTTTTYVVESILTAAGIPTGVIGTVNIRFGERTFASTHTTPGAVELQGLLRQMADAGCKAVVMEISSHALKQERAAFLALDAVIFTNLTPEHLDYHPDMEDYFQSKALLFTRSIGQSIAMGKSPCAAINRDDDSGARLLRELKKREGFTVLGYGSPEWSVGVAGISGRLPAGTEFKCGLTGLFNAYNILAAVTACEGLGIPERAIAQGLNNLRTVPGRLESVPNDRGLHVFVDYAHKPDALQNVLETLGSVKGPGRLLTVFGCGGDRDRSKRPVMGQIAVALSDQVWITSDNPRTEDPMAIIAEIVGGLPKPGQPGAGAPWVIDADRERAIQSALSAARAGDIVLIAGKGHEDYQIIGDRKIHFDDREVARRALEKK